MWKSLAATTSVLVAIFAAAACSSETESTFTAPPPQPEAAPAPESPLLAEAGPAAADAEAGPSSCPPSMPETFAPTFTAKAKQSACTTEEIAAYYTACLADPGTTENDGTCAAFEAAHATCVSCAEPADDTGPVQWQNGRKFYTLNVAGCIAVTQGDGAAGSCADAYNAAIECSRQSCESCFDLGGTFDQFAACQQSALGSDGCKDYVTTESQACTGYKAAGAPAVPCFTEGSETQEDHYTRFVGLLCGP